VENFKIIAGKKYMWDGEEHDSQSAAHDNQKKYDNDGFETQLITEDGVHRLYSRRVAAEVIVEGGVS